MLTTVLLLNIGGEGRQYDNTIFQNNELSKRLNDGSLQISAAKYVMISNIKLSYILIADESNHVYKAVSAK